MYITKDNVINKLTRSYELSKNCSKIKVQSVMMRTGELGNACSEPYIDSQFLQLVFYNENPLYYFTQANPNNYAICGAVACIR